MRRRLMIVLAATLLAGVAVVGSGCGGKQASPAASATPPDLGLTAANCRHLVNLPVTFTDAVTGLPSDLDETHAVLKKFARRSPLEIRPDFIVLTAASVKITTTLKGVDLSSNAMPSAAEIAKLRKLSSVVDTAKVTEASSNISAWAQKNCSGAGRSAEGGA